jgi:hypothetical protein
MSLAIVTAVRQRYPTPLGAQHLAFLNAVGVELGLGLVQKTSGTFIPHPTAGGVSQDVLMSRDGAAWDILIDAEGAATPAWNSVAPIEPSRYVTAEGNPAPPIPPDPPVPQPCDLSEVLAKLDTLQRSVDLIDPRTLYLRLGNLREVIDDIRARQDRALTGRFSFGTMRFTPEE